MTYDLQRAVTVVDQLDGVARGSGATRATALVAPCQITPQGLCLLSGSIDEGVDCPAAERPQPRFIARFQPIDDRGLAAVSFDRSRFCVKRVSYADLRSEDPCLGAVDAMNQEFLEHTGENSSALSQSIATPSKSTRWSSAFVAAVPRVAPGGCARAHDGLVGPRPDDWDRPRPRCRRLNFWCVDARHPSRRDVPALESISIGRSA